MHNLYLQRTDVHVAALRGDGDSSSPRRLRLIAAAAAALHLAVFFVHFPARPPAPPPPEPERFVPTFIHKPAFRPKPEFPREDVPPPPERRPVPPFEEPERRPLRETEAAPALPGDSWASSALPPEGPPPPKWLDGEALPAGATPPVKIRHAEPAYPPDALRVGLEGTVVLRIRVDEEGRVVSAEETAAGPLPAFAEAAREAVMRWRYSPASYRGRPVGVSMVVTVKFSLK
jgi:periplasmic protein TonB